MNTNGNGYVSLELLLSMIRLTQTKFNMDILSIRYEMDYKKALERLELIFDAKQGTKEVDQLEMNATENLNQLCLKKRWSREWGILNFTL